MKTSTTLLNPTSAQSQKDESLSQAYEVIENEAISERNFEELTISGALFSLSTFDRASFSTCVFYACKLENTTFKNCNFENCTFEFTSFFCVQFISCTFTNCTWEFSSARKSFVKSSSIDRVTAANFAKDSSNHLLDCYTPDPELTRNSIDLVELYEQWFAA